MPPRRIKVNDKALAHLSRGLYRSPASAIRELVSNAWDAGAENVVITTGIPSFTQLSITDDGLGMDARQFESLMTGGIGNSQKRKDDETLAKSAFNHTVNRPILGRFGIGLLGIAQVCSSFIFASRTKDGATFAARVRIEDFVRDRMDDTPASAAAKPESSADGLFIGEWELLSPDKQGNIEGFSLPRPSGTLLIVTDPHPAFVRSFRDTLRPPVSASQERKEASHKSAVVLDAPMLNPPTYDEIREALPPSVWDDVVEAMRETAFLDSRGDYWRFLWDLAASCPLPYISSNAIPDHLIVSDQQRLERYRFRVEVDGRELRKPVALADGSEYLSLAIAQHAVSLFGRKLKFHGYIAAQEGQQLKPDEMQGLMVRIKDVGVGPFDSGMLGYRVNQGPRSRWLTGEIFVEEGLEDAVNVDRDSFNTFHPHYKELQRVVHLYLARAFSLSYAGITKRSKASAKRRAMARREHLEQVVAENLGRSAEIRRTSDLDATAHVTPKRIVIDAPDPDELRTKRSNRELAAAVLSLYAVAETESGAASRARRFRDLLLDLLRRW